ncbi:MAG TPA: MerR family transcriptional regulator [Propionibacteriaceae bacterium]|nr:MerR family transcriptional regulator [Propionibacteriaceae bacterium]
MSTMPDPAAGVFGISVAAELVGTGVQNLRAYERAGLLEPRRTPGGTRLYSSDDIERLRHIAALLNAGLNLIGVAMVLDLELENALLREEIADHRRGPTDAEGT